MTDMGFVGREKELAMLSTCFDRLDQDQFSLIFVRGAAGSGKTTLVNRFREILTERYPETLIGSGFCNAQTGLGDPYLPFRRILDELFESAEDKRRKQDNRTETTLKNLFAFSAKCVVEYAPDLIGAFVPGGAIVQGISKFAIQEAHVSEKLAQLSKPQNQKPELQESSIREQYTNLVDALSEKHKLLLIIDDLHWADDASISLLYHLAQSLKKQHIMIVCMYRESDVSIGRDGNRHPLERISNELQRIFGNIWVDLDKLNQDELRQFSDQQIDMHPNKLDRNFRETIFAITNGNALFTQELLRNLQENGSLVKDENQLWVENGTVDWSTIPSRVEGIFRERINHLEDSHKEILLMASVQGKDFLVQAIASLMKMSDRELVRTLSEVLDKRHKLIREGKARRVGGKVQFYFGFADTLIQQFIYNELSVSEQMLFSNDIAEILETSYGTDAAEIAVDLAHLYQVAGNDEKAAEYAFQAGNKAFRLGAYREASQHFYVVLKSLEQLPENNLNRKLKLEAMKSLSLSLKPIEGFSGPNVVKYANQAIELGYELKEFKSISPVMFTMWSNYLTKLELEQAKTYALKYLSLGNELVEREILFRSALALAITVFWQGEPKQSQVYMQDFFSHYDSINDSDQLERYGHDPNVMALAYSSLMALVLGDVNNADKHSREALELAHRLDHPFSQAVALTFAMYVAYFLTDLKLLEEYCNQMIALAERWGFVFYIGAGKIFGGVISGRSGQYLEAISLIETGYLQYIFGKGSKMMNSSYGLCKAEVQLLNTQPAQALDTLEKTIQVARDCGEMVYYPELLRMESRALSLMGDRRAALEKLTESIAYANKDKTVTLELRSLLDLYDLEPDDLTIKMKIQDCLDRFISIRPYADITRAYQILN